MRVPIACELSPEAATDRVEEWRQALHASVTAAARPAPGRWELRMADGPTAPGRLVDLARREKACCGFFRFTVDVAAEGATMVVEVPEEAVSILDDFASLLGS